MAPFDLQQATSFVDLHAQGFRELIPVIPPGAKSPLPPALYGKAPGIKDQDGQWWPFKGWRHTDTSMVKLLQWSTWGGNIGLRCGEMLWAIDLDITSESLADTFRTQILAKFGTTLERTGNYPKTALIYRCMGPVPSCSILFEVNGKRHRIDILGVGKQIVLAGIHPSTLQPYRRNWHGVGRANVDALPAVDATAVLDMLKALVAKAGGTIVTLSRPGRVAAGHAPDQAGLKAPIEWVRGVMASLSNDAERFGAYDRWLDVGYALKAATQDDPGAGRDMWLEWCGRYEGQSDAEENLRTWEKIKGPFYLGAHALADIAGVSSASLDFGPIADGEDEAPSWATFFHLEGEDSLEAAPPDLSLVDGLLGERTLAILWGRSGSLKSFIAQSLSVAVAAGLPWMGRTTTQGGVFYFAGEGGAALGVRIVAARQQAGAVKGSLKYWRRANVGPEIIRPEIRRAMIEACLAMGKEWDIPVRLVILDTMATTYTGEENSNSDLRDYFKAASEIRNRTGATVLIVDHSGKDEDRGVRGGQAKRDFADTAIHVERPDPESPRVSFTIEKQRDGEDNVRLELEAVRVSADLGDHGVFETLAMTGGGQPTGHLSADDLAAIVTALGVQDWRADRRSKDYVGVPVAQAMGLNLAVFAERTQVEQTLKWLVNQGKLEVIDYRDKTRHARQYVRVKSLDPFS